MLPTEKHIFCIFALILRFNVEGKTTLLSSDVQDCSKLPKLSILPGGGWCNLRNKQMGQVQRLSYDQCKTTPDGLFRIPDSTIAVPVLESNVQLFAEIIDSWKNFSSTTSRSINVQAEGEFEKFDIGGSFSYEYMTFKENQINQKAVTTRIQTRYVMYTIESHADNELDSYLLSQLNRAILALKSKNSKELDYIMEMIVREHGTYVLTRVEAGAILYQEEFISRDYREDSTGNSESIKLAASARFFTFFNFSSEIKTSVNNSDQTSYENSLKSSISRSVGGILFTPGSMSIDNWVRSIPTHLATIDRDGDPLHFIITPATFPNEPRWLVDQLRLELQSAIGRYYHYNMHLGCMNPDAANFDFNANVDSNLCNETIDSYKFGGVYQTCESDNDNELVNRCQIKDLEHKNMLTNDFTCPPNFESVMLFNFSETVHDDCGKIYSGTYCFFNWVYYVYSTYTYTTYWCAAVQELPDRTGVLFGGFFSSKISNPITKSYSCPSTYTAAKVFEDFSVCISNDFELGKRYSADFAGFFSCMAGNPTYDTNGFKKKKLLRGTITDNLSHQISKACPKGYTQHTAIEQNNCLISYCVKAGSFKQYGEMSIIIPPFQNYTDIFNINDSITFNQKAAWTGFVSFKNMGIALVITSSVAGTVLVMLVVGLVGRMFCRKYQNRSYVQVPDTIEEEQSLLSDR